MLRYVYWTSLFICFLTTVAAVLDHRFPLDLTRAQQHSVTVVDAENTLLRGFTTREGSWRLPLDVKTVDPLYLDMLKAFEDQRFDWHPGVDPLAVARALGQWLQYGRVVSGASTLTMQTVRLLQPRPRAWRSKLIEMARALQLEWHHDKDTILTLYLTLAPFGSNLEGLQAASLAWLGKPPHRLTPAEAALLVALPQAPSRLRPDRFEERAQAARNKVLLRIQRAGILSAQQVQEARQAPVPTARHPLPFHAPHLARRLHRAEPERDRHQTFIDADLQRLLETLAQGQALEPKRNLAILVVENVTRKVLAYVGSADFFATSASGQVDMVQAIRSPGSTLKPLVYGMGFEDGLIHPETLIDDIPTRFGDYGPTNFHHSYGGQISIREALQRSQNVPAVALLDRIGPLRVAARLHQGGIRLRWQNGQVDPGLPLILGGVGTTLEDLVTLYAAIANGGEVAPLRFSSTSATPPGQRLLSPAAAWYLTHILAGAAPPASVVAATFLRHSRPIAYKTGTSYGFRDAWALGYDQDYTVGVWLGRPDGSPSLGRSGRSAAAPLLFRVFALLPASKSRPSALPPEGVMLYKANSLPEHLRYFSLQSEPTNTAQPALRVSFPVADTRVALTRQGRRWDKLPLLAEGGKRPLRWFVNGSPVASAPLHRQTFWNPDGEGFVHITVMDALGQIAQVNAWIEANDH